MSEPGSRVGGWRRGDAAAWWDGEQRQWRRGTLTARHAVPSYVYDVAADDGSSVSIPERLLRSVEDPGVRLPDPPTSTARATVPPPVRPGASLADRPRPHRHGS